MNNLTQAFNATASVGSFMQVFNQEIPDPSSKVIILVNVKRLHLNKVHIQAFLVRMKLYPAWVATRETCFLAFRSRSHSTNYSFEQPTLQRARLWIEKNVLELQPMKCSVCQESMEALNVQMVSCEQCFDLVCDTCHDNSKKSLGVDRCPTCLHIFQNRWEIN